MTTRLIRPRRLAATLATIALIGCAGTAIAGPRTSLRPPPAGDAALCSDAIRTVERDAQIPAALLGAIALVESGRTDPASSQVTPWPWTINVAGTGYVFDTKIAAMAAVQAAQAAGVQSIDVGCMQVNLLHHPHAFATLDDAFAPQANVVYAAAFLGRLHTQTGGWPQATAAYHSLTTEIGASYARRVMAIWPLANRYGAASFLATPAVPKLASSKIDPYGVMTPGFRSRLVQEAVADHAAWVAMGIVPASRPARPARPSHLRMLSQAGSTATSATLR